jgi:hypothetical protein
MSGQSLPELSNQLSEPVDFERRQTSVSLAEGIRYAFGRETALCGPNQLLLVGLTVAGRL